MTSRPLACLGLAAAFFLSSIGDARADDRAAAQILFEQGRDLVAKGLFAEACPKFVESLRLDRGIGTMLWLADCQENVGQRASAWATFKEAAAAAALTKDPREKLARHRATALLPKLAYLTINVPSFVSGIEVRRNGILAGQAEWGVAVPLDAGSHKVEATAPNHTPWATTVTLPDAKTVVVDVPALQPHATEEPRTPPGTIAPKSSGADRNHGKTQRVLGLGVAALGIVGLGVGTFFSFDAKSTYDKSESHCLPDNRCDPMGTSQRNDAMSEATIATIVLGTGLAALAGGIVLYLTAPKSQPSAALSGVRF